MVRSNKVDPALPVQKTLAEIEAEKVKQATTSKLSSADAARLAARAGFQRVRAKKQKGLDIGDSSGQEYSLPEEDLDPEAWTPQRLESAQGNLALARAQLAEIANSTENMAAALVGGSFMPVQEDLAAMQALADRSPPAPVPMLEEVSTNVGRLFGIELESVPPGHKALAMGLVVAGETSAVQVKDGKLQEQELAGGIEKVTQRGNQSVTEAHRMSKGVEAKLNVQRTFVFKR
jgi:hypothetical protein